MIELDPHVFSEDGKYRIRETVARIAPEAQERSSTGGPTGACHIKIWDTPICVDHVSQVECIKMAAELGGAATWSPGTECNE